MVVLCLGSGFPGGLGQKCTRRWHFGHQLGGEVCFVLQTSLRARWVLKENQRIVSAILVALNPEYRDDEISQSGHDTW